MLRDKSSQNWMNRIKANGFFDKANSNFILDLINNTLVNITTKCLIQEKLHYSVNIHDLKSFSLFRSKYIIKRQIINSRNKVFGVEVTNKKTNVEFFIPLKNSGIHKDIPYDFYDESIWKDYDTTKVNLKKLIYILKMQ